MVKRRILKRSINRACTDLLAECVAASLYNTKENQENMEALLYSIIKTGNDSIRRVSHPEPGMTAKAYFKDLTDKFNKDICEIVDQINNLG